MLASGSNRLMSEVPDNESLINAPCGHPVIPAENRGMVS
jgi:hypothetical protein